MSCHSLTVDSLTKLRGDPSSCHDCVCERERARARERERERERARARERERCTRERAMMHDARMPGMLTMAVTEPVKKKKEEMTATSENVSVKVLERTEARATGVASTATGSSLYVVRNET